MLDLIHAAHVITITGSVGSGKTGALIKIFQMLHVAYQYADIFTYERRFIRQLESSVNNLSNCNIHTVNRFDEVYDMAMNVRRDSILVVDDLSIFGSYSPNRLHELVHRYPKVIVTQQSSFTSLSLTSCRLGLLELSSSIYNDKCYLRHGNQNVAVDDIVKLQNRRDSLESILKTEQTDI